jgi:hypothetical protein
MMRDTLTVTRLLTDKRALDRSRVETAQEDAQPAAGDAILRIDRVAITTNNLTYAAFGDAMQYWHFFPVADPGWGHMPAWGFADVIATAVPGVEIGERFYGYFPIASHIRMRPERVKDRGFYDGAEHRRALTSAYNQYMRCSADECYAQADENYQMIVRPLFITSFMLADFLADNGFFGASRLVFSSASSKTGYGTAFCMQGRDDIELVALTSPRNRAFVERLGCYRQTLPYGALASVATDKPVLYVDFSGDEALRARVHRHFGSTLVYDCFAGSAQNTQFLRKIELPGPEPRFFFAPVQIKKRNADWGHEVVNQRFNEAQRRFIAQVSAGSNSWMRVVENRGFEAAQRVIAGLVNGTIDPVDGHVVVLG